MEEPVHKLRLRLLLLLAKPGEEHFLRVDKLFEILFFSSSQKINPKLKFQN